MSKIIKHPLRILFATSFLFAGHMALVAYVNSSFLGEFINNNLVGILYSIGAALTIFGLLNMQKILNKFGGYKTILILVSLSILSLIGFSTLSTASLVILIFIVYLAINSLIYFALDILIENYSKDETTGKTRGIFLTTMNAAWVISPLIAGFIVATLGFRGVYFIALLSMIPVFLILAIKFKNFKDPNYTKTPLRHVLSKVLKNKNILKVFKASFLLQFFYSWMVIYTPIYLFKHIGLNWESIGIIFTIMLIPFVILEIPVGQLADKRIKEKYLMTIGFIIMGVTTGLLAFLGKPSVALWALALFGTRIGASIVEITTESYFFKQVNAEDIDTISFYRNASPLAYIIAPIVATVMLLFIPFNYLFVVLGLIVLSGIYLSTTLNHEKSAVRESLATNS